MRREAILSIFAFGPSNKSICNFLFRVLDIITNAVIYCFRNYISKVKNNENMHSKRFKHEYLRSCASRCLSLSSPPYLYVKLLRYSCLHLGSYMYLRLKFLLENKLIFSFLFIFLNCDRRRIFFIWEIFYFLFFDIF